MTPILASDRLIVALDLPGLDEAQRLVDALAPAGVTHFKIGLGLFTRVGPPAIEMVHRRGGRVFLDLKFHDIPNTVAQAVRSAARFGVWMTNLHIQGGSAMMRQAAQAARAAAAGRGGESIRLIGVTVLTSMAERDLIDLGVRKRMKDQVLYLARLAEKAGLNGIVASAQEAKALRWAFGNDFLIVTPGIRPSPAEGQGILSVSGDDQQRTATAKEAIGEGADYLVVGRPILEAKDPAAAAKEIIHECEGDG